MGAPFGDNVRAQLDSVTELVPWPLTKFRQRSSRRGWLLLGGFDCPASSSQGEMFVFVPNSAVLYHSTSPRVLLRDFI